MFHITVFCILSHLCITALANLRGYEVRKSDVKTQLLTAPHSTATFSLRGEGGKGGQYELISTDSSKASYKTKIAAAAPKLRRLQESNDKLTSNDEAKHQHEMDHMLLNNKTRPVFGIIMATNRRPQDPLMYLVGNTSLKSFASQTYRRWHLFVGGDALSEEEVRLLEEQVHTAGLPKSRVHFINIPVEQSERSIHPNVHDMWMHGGTAARNAAAKFAYANPSVTHIALVGDDDIYLPNHLLTLAHGFNIAEDIGFVHTRATLYETTTRLLPAGEISGPYSFEPPKPCALIAATSAWSKRYLNNTYDRSKAQQQVPGALHSRMPNNPCNNPYILPNDADTWDRIWRMIDVDHAFKGVYIPKLTVDYLSREYKTANIFPRLYGNATK